MLLCAFGCLAPRAVVLPVFPSGGRFNWLYNWVSEHYGGIDRCCCPWRWLEYSISASVMIMAISALGGIRERITIALVFVNMSFCQFFGYLGERMAGWPAQGRAWPHRLPLLEGRGG